MLPELIEPSAAEKIALGRGEHHREAEIERQLLAKRPVIPAAEGKDFVHRRNQAEH